MRMEICSMLRMVTPVQARLCLVLRPFVAVYSLVYGSYYCNCSPFDKPCATRGCLLSIA